VTAGIRVERGGAVAQIVLARPEKLNALSWEMFGRLEAALLELDADPDVRCIQLRGEGRAFCVGADIADLPADRPAVLDYMRATLRALSTPERLRTHVVAGVQGLVLGGGLELVLACDVVIASDDARFGLPEPSLGLVPGLALRRLPAVAGRATARRLLLLQEQLTAAEALACGLVLRTVAAGDLIAAVDEVAAGIAGGAPLALTAVKRALAVGSAGPGEWDDVAATNAELSASADAAEGRAAFVDRRPPVFRGR
jgi:enoyl-CoA hydratase/carnithine racemase